MEALFSVRCDGVETKPGTVAGAGGRAGAGAGAAAAAAASAGARSGVWPLAPDGGPDQIPADFRSELAARLASRVESDLAPVSQGRPAHPAQAARPGRGIAALASSDAGAGPDRGADSAAIDVGGDRQRPSAVSGRPRPAEPDPRAASGVKNAPSTPAEAKEPGDLAPVRDAAQAVLLAVTPPCLVPVAQTARPASAGSAPLLETGEGRGTAIAPSAASPDTQPPAQRGVNPAPAATSPGASEPALGEAWSAITATEGKSPGRPPERPVQVGAGMAREWPAAENRAKAPRHAGHFAERPSVDPGPRPADASVAYEARVEVGQERGDAGMVPVIRSEAIGYAAPEKRRQAGIAPGEARVSELPEPRLVDGARSTGNERTRVSEAARAERLPGEPRNRTGLEPGAGVSDKPQAPGEHGWGRAVTIEITPGDETPVRLAEAGQESSPRPSGSTSTGAAGRGQGFAPASAVGARSRGASPTVADGAPEGAEAARWSQAAGRPAEKAAPAAPGEAQPAAQRGVEDTVDSPPGLQEASGAGRPAFEAADGPIGPAWPGLERPAMRGGEPGTPVLETEGTTPSGARPGDSRHPQDARAVPGMPPGEDEVAPVDGASTMQAREVAVDKELMVAVGGEAEAEAGQEPPDAQSANAKTLASPASLGAPEEEPGARMQAVEVVPPLEARPQPTGEGARGQVADASEDATTHRNGSPGSAAAGAVAPEREPSRDLAARVDEGRVRGVQASAPRASGAPEPGRGERSAAATAERGGERRDGEPVSGKPLMAAAMPDAQDVRAEMRPREVSGGDRAQQAPVTARSVIDQIVQRAELRLARSEAEMVIDLKPGVLGKVHLRITAEPGRVVAEIRAESAVTRQLIESGLPDLRTALARKGLDLGTIAVSGDLGSGVAWNGARSRWFQGDNGPGGARASPGGAGMNGVHVAGSLIAARPHMGRTHLVDCMA